MVQIHRLDEYEQSDFMLNLINRCEKLKDEISSYFDDPNNIAKELISSEYKSLKVCILAAKHYVSLNRNKSGNLVYKAFIVPSIKEACASNNAQINCKIDYKMYDAVDERGGQVRSIWGLE